MFIFSRRKQYLKPRIVSQFQRARPLATKRVASSKVVKQPDKGYPEPPIRHNKRVKKDENPVIRNPAGVQLLSRPLHEQIFRNVSVSPPDDTYTNLSLQHLKAHNLDPGQAQTVPNVAFTLPELRGPTIDAHFYAIGKQLADPSKQLAESFAESSVPPMPSMKTWKQTSGWTKYTPVKGKKWKIEPGEGPYSEDALVFDVETMPKYHHYSIMACAVSKTSWYCWISPWLLGETTEPDHLIPLSQSAKISATPECRIVIGHNVAYDRARVKDEYNLAKESSLRWIDTMALHIAVKGISSVQRPAWIAWNKARDEAQSITAEEQVEEGDSSTKDHVIDPSENPEDVMDHENRRWEAVTSVNSLLEVAKLYCGIKMTKETRNAFMTSTPAEILTQLPTYLDYCARDVHTTFLVFQKTLPLFLSTCPHPVSWAGIMRMGNSFLTVNSEWKRYLEQAEGKYRELESGVKNRLAELAEHAKSLFEGEKWRGDVWLEQMDWTPKVAGKGRGYWVLSKKERDALEKAHLEPKPVTPTKQKTRKKKETPTVNEPSSEKSSKEPKQVLLLDIDIPDHKFPRWLADLTTSFESHHVQNVILPLLLQVKWGGRFMYYSPEHGWLRAAITQNTMLEGEEMVQLLPTDPTLALVPSPDKTIFIKPNFPPNQPFWTTSVIRKILESQKIKTINDSLAEKLIKQQFDEEGRLALEEIVKAAVSKAPGKRNSALLQLDWTTTAKLRDEITPPTETRPSNSFTPPEGYKYPPPMWPKWYWELTKPRKDAPPGSLDITVRNRLTPLLLRLGWLGNPLFHSREHGWCYRVAPCVTFSDPPPAGLASTEIAAVVERSPRSSPLVFTHPNDHEWAYQTTAEGGGYTFYKVPHAHGESANVGSPLSKDFIKYAQDGTLGSIAATHNLGAEGATMEVVMDEAKKALEMNAQCSYWISARDRVLNQIVIWEKEKGELGLGQSEADAEETWGMILPQVITMGTVTRRAIEKTWLTASNAKKNRVGSELKAMVRAPPGYAIVGADVDSEELWISSLMGDAQFGIHGATAIGWMTLEGTKQAGTDLHSKTASILGISRDAAKVFNYSRIYGAGMRHAMLLLLQANPGMSATRAQKLAQNLYANTKGKNTNTTRFFGTRFWHGGTESFLFNRLEAIATGDAPMTPALGCGVTSALSKKHLPTDVGTNYLTSRINWVVQSSGVDYLHLLITATDYLFNKYKIDGRYMISVHDEVRYLVKENDRYRAALALQIANLWTRSLFAFRLGLDDLPASVGFFSAVDIDFALRKEVYMECVTPSQLIPLPPGEALDIQQLLGRTHGGSLHLGGTPMNVWKDRRKEPPPADGYVAPDCTIHRAIGRDFLKAQSTTQIDEVRLHSDLWARHLIKNGRENEVKSWNTMNSKKYRERKADYAMVVESFNLPDEHYQPSLNEIAEAINV